jgi:hypothetical protein
MKHIDQPKQDQSPKPQIRLRTQLKAGPDKSKDPPKLEGYWGA